MELTELATEQHAVAHVAQLAAAGVAKTTISRRLRDGVWARVLPGVVALHPGGLSGAARRHAVALWLPDGVLCGPTAAALHGIRTRPTTVVHVAVPRGHPRGAPWVRVHRVGPLPPSHVTSIGGLPVTSAARTVVDVHDETVGATERQAVVVGAVQRRLVRPRSVIDAAVTTPGLRRRGELADTVLRTLSGAESVAEIAFAEFCAGWGLPPPATQHEVATRLGPVRVDFAFVAERVAVEVDGFDGHAFDRQRRRDHERDLALAALGWLVVRLEPRRLIVSPELVYADLANTLDERRPGGAADPTAVAANA